MKMSGLCLRHKHNVNHGKRHGYTTRDLPGTFGLARQIKILKAFPSVFTTLHNVSLFLTYGESCCPLVRCFCKGEIIRQELVNLKWMIYHVHFLGINKVYIYLSIYKENTADRTGQSLYEMNNYGMDIRFISPQKWPEKNHQTSTFRIS